MSDMELDNDFMLSDSSSPSSPSPGAADSSPLSSPSIGPVSTPPESPGLAHPYAGSTKGVKHPPRYEKRYDTLGWGRTKSTASRVGAHDHSDGEGCDIFRDDQSPSHASGSTCSPVSSTRKHNVYTRTSSQIVHPFAASAKGGWKAARAEKSYSRTPSRSNIPSTSTLGSSDSGKLHRQSTGSLTDVETTSVDAVPVNITHAAPAGSVAHSFELSLWDNAITQAIDRADGNFEIGNYGLLATQLTYIPPSIADLASLVVLTRNDQQNGTPPPYNRDRPFIRSTTAPAFSEHSRPFLDRAASSQQGQSLVKAASSAGLASPPPAGLGALHLRLGGHLFKTLPAELFQLTRTASLILRQNRLSVIPPQIVQLANLRILHLGSNRLRWLPAEMLDMHLMELSLSPNPWLKPNDFQEVSPDATTEHVKQGTAGRKVSRTDVRFTVPSLTELCYRVLLAPAAPAYSNARPQTVLEAYYSLPLSGTGAYPTSVMEVLRACLPAAVAKPAQATTSPAKKARRDGTGSVHRPEHPAVSGLQDSTIDDEDTPPSIGVCPSPLHRTAQGEWVGGRVPVFVQHAEERFTWERVVAGVDIGSADGVDGVPVRWRGCGRGCLDFLDEAAEGVEEGSNEDVEMSVDEVQENASGSTGVRAVVIGEGVADMEDFY